MNRDPFGYYAFLGIGPGASAEEVKAAFRRRARRLHPDVRGTGDAEAFRSLNEAYRVLADPVRRARYDNAGQAFTQMPPQAEPPPPLWTRHFSRPALAGLAVALTCLAAVTLAVALRAPSPSSPAQIASPSPPGVSATPAAPAIPPPLAGVPNSYVLPGGSRAAVWGGDPEGRLSKLGELDPFTPVHAEGPVIDGLRAIALANGGVAYVEARRLIRGSAREAEQARCAFTAGRPPRSGDVLARGVSGPARLLVRNREAVSAMVTLRTEAGGLAARVYLGPGEQAELSGLPHAPLREQAVFGELWSRGCGRFVTGERRQISEQPALPGGRLELTAGD